MNQVFFSIQSPSKPRQSTVLPHHAVAREQLSLIHIFGLVLAGIVAAIFGILIGVPALRLKGDYLAIITLGFGEIIRVCIINLPEITGGTPGMMGIPKHANFLVVYLAVVVTCMVIHLMMKSRHGRAILSIRENEIAAESCGINITYYKVLAFAVSSFFAGVAGALYAGYQGLLTPTSFEFMASINILVMVVLGGMGSMIGSVIAAAVLTSLPLALQALNTYRMVIYSILLIATMIFKPSGLMGTYDCAMSLSLIHISGHGQSAEGIDGGLDQHVGNGEHRALQARRQTDP